MKTKALLYAALAFLFVSCDENESEAKEAAILAQEESSPQQVSEISAPEMVEQEKKKTEIKDEEEKAAALEAAEQAKKQKIDETVAACLARIKENPKAVFEWDNSIELDKPENEELVKAVIEAHSRELVRMAVTPEFQYDLSELKEEWPYSYSHKEWRYDCTKDLERLSEKYLNFYENSFARINILEKGRDSDGNRTVESIKNDKIKCIHFLANCSYENVTTVDKSCFDEKGNAYKTYRCDKLYGTPRTLAKLIEENAHCSSELGRSAFQKMREKFAPEFDALLQEIANTSYPAWYEAPDASQHINMQYKVSYGLCLKDIKNALKSNGASSKMSLRARVAAAYEAAVGVRSDYAINSLLDEFELAIWKAQEAYQEERLLSEFGERLKSIIWKTRNDMPQYVLAEAQSMNDDMIRQRWNNDFDFLLRTHKDYTPKEERGYPSDLAPVDGANGVGVIANSRVFQDVYFGMTVQELFACEGAKILAEKYDVNEFIARMEAFSLSTVTTLFGHPANVCFVFRPALSQNENGQTEIINKLCMIEYSVVTPDDVKKELEQAQKRAQDAYDQAESQAKVAQVANDLGWSKTARKASANTLNNLGEILAASQQAEQIRQSQRNVINLWLEGFCSAKKPYREVGGIYTNNPYVKQSEEKSSVFIHDAAQEREDADINLLEDCSYGDKYSVRLYPARYMSLAYRIDVAKKILTVMFAKQYMDYQKNKTIHENANEF